MGFYSWKTVHGESIPCNQSQRETSPVYLLQPNGEPPIKEVSYDGYGNFGGMNAYAWLANKNYGDPKFRDIAMRASRGSLIYIEDSSYIYIPEHERELLTEFLSLKENKKNLYVYKDSQEILPNTMTPMQMRQHKLGVSDTLMFPLKFSHRPDDQYENFSASSDCPNQGFFYPEQWEFIAITNGPLPGLKERYRLCENANDPEYGLLKSSEINAFRKDLELIIIPKSQLQEYLTFHLEHLYSTPHILHMDVEAANPNLIGLQLKLTRNWQSQVLLREAEKLDNRIKNLSPLQMLGLLKEQASKLSIKLPESFQQAILNAMESPNTPTISNAVFLVSNALMPTDMPTFIPNGDFGHRNDPQTSIEKPNTLPDNPMVSRPRR